LEHWRQLCRVIGFGSNKPVTQRAAARRLSEAGGSSALSSVDSIFKMSKMMPMKAGAVLKQALGRYERSLCRYELIEALTRLAITHYVDRPEDETVQMSVSDAVVRMWHELLRPCMPVEATRFFGDAWRRERLYTQALDEVLSTHNAALQEVFGAFAIDTANKGHHRGFKSTLHMSFREWQVMLTECMLPMHAHDVPDRGPSIDAELSALVFSCAKTYVRDPVFEHEQQQYLTYHEFIEALCRFADVTDLPNGGDYARAEGALEQAAVGLSKAAAVASEAAKAADEERGSGDSVGDGSEGSASEGGTTPGSTPLQMASRMALRRAGGAPTAIAIASASAAAATFTAAAPTKSAADVAQMSAWALGNSSAPLPAQLTTRYLTGRILSATSKLCGPVVAGGGNDESAADVTATTKPATPSSTAMANHGHVDISTIAFPVALRPTAVPAIGESKRGGGERKGNDSTDNAIGEFSSSIDNNALATRVHMLLPLLLLGARYKMKQGTMAAHRHTVAADMGSTGQRNLKGSAIASSLSRLKLKDGDMLAYESARRAWEAVGGKKVHVSANAEPTPLRKATITVMPTSRKQSTAGITGLAAKGLMAQKAALKFKLKLLPGRHTAV
jgi:hypothetical protein